MGGILLKKYLSILVCLIVLFLNISVVANAASETKAPTPTTPITATPTTKTTTTASHSVSFNSNDVLVADISVEYNEKVVKPLDPTKTGYTFGGWYKDNNSYAEPFDFENTAIIEDITLFAKWTINSYAVIFNSQGGSSINNISADDNNAITAPADPTRSGYTFGGWYKEAGCINPWNFTTDKVTGNTMLYAKWKVVTPVSPTGLTAASQGYNSISIKWGAVTGASGYEVYRSTSNGGTYTLISTTNATNYTDTGLTTGSNYYYKVKAYRNVGNVKVYSSDSTIISSKPILSAPTNLKSTRISSNSIRITWSGVSGANGYELYSATSSAGYYKLLTKTKSTYYTNSGLITGRTYYYKLRSYRTVGKTKIYSNWTTVVNAKP